MISATNREPAKDVEGVIGATAQLRHWADRQGDATAIAAVKAITHHNWSAADTMPAPYRYNSSAARAALDAVRSGDLPREAFNNADDGDLPRTTTGMQAAVTLKLLHEAGALIEPLTVLTNAYGVELRDVEVAWGHSVNSEQAVVEQNRITRTGSDGFQRGGMPYVQPSPTAVDEESSAEPLLFLWNSDAIDRGTKAHKDLEVGIAERLRERGLHPLSPHGGDEPFDIAWVADRVLHICEVKSLTDVNEESQLRLGLGQLLGYLYRTNIVDWPEAERKRGVLAVERPPTRLDWVGICAESGVILTWPDHIPDLLGG